jgi:hypothetical protein
VPMALFFNGNACLPCLWFLALDGWMDAWMHACMHACMLEMPLALTDPVCSELDGG